MRRLDRAFDRLASRGYRSDPDRVIDRLERRLAGEPAVVRIPGRPGMDTTSNATSRRYLWIGVTATAAALLVGVPLILLRGDEPLPVADTPATGATTTTTTVAATSLPTEGSLDALGAYAAGPVPSPATCPTGSTPDVAGDPGAPRPPAPDVADGGAAFDRHSGLLVLRGMTSTWLFDPCRNRWEERAVAGPQFGPNAYKWMVYDEDSDLVVASEGGFVWTYDTDADVWSRLPIGNLPGSTGQARYHPPSGLIVLFEEPGDAGVEGTWGYDVDAAVRLDLGYGLDLGSEQTGPTPNHRLSAARGLVVFDRVENVWYLYQVSHSNWIPATWQFMPGRGWARVDVITASADFPWGDLYNGEEIAFDEESGWITLLSQGQLAGFDPTVPAWEILYSVSREAMPADGPAYRTGAQLIYDSANGRFIMLGGWLGVSLGEAPADDVWAYDVATREWTLLLAAAQ